MPRFRTIDRDDDRHTAKRIFIIGAIFACSFGILVSRAVSFHLKDNELLEKVALRQYRTAVHQSTKRGRILDVRGRELAIDVAVDSVFANPREIMEPVETADKLARMLSIDRRKLLDRFSGQRKFTWVERRVSEAESEAIKKEEIRGLYTMRESKRFYPNGDLAAALLGAVGFDSKPLGGIELFYNDVISWQTRPGDFRRDARGHLYLSPVEYNEPLQADVELTIDKTLQYIAERELAKGMQKAHAKGGTVIVVDVGTAAILAMASLPSFDPNEYEKYPFDRWRNHAISDVYEPGSTFKVMVVAAALDAGVTTPEDVFDCENGKIRIGDHIVRDAHPHGKLSVADIIKVSSNIGAHKVEKKLGRRHLYDAIRKFGFGEESGILLPGESPGLLSPPEGWSELQFATIAFGQGMAATPLQMAMSFAAIANDGELLKPYIVKRVVGGNGQILKSSGKEVVRRAISSETAMVMANMLSRVTEEGGTGTLAASSEYRVAGKTGTAQKADPRSGGYVAGKYHSSFIGFAPVEAPRLVIYVGIDEPTGGLYYGGQVAAPVFREIMESSLHYLKVPASPQVFSPSVIAQLPPKESSGDLAVVELALSDERRIAREGDNKWRLPDFAGLTMRGVLESAHKAEIVFEFVGTGVAVSQSPPPGEAVFAGAKCTVKFEPLPVIAGGGEVDNQGVQAETTL